MSTAEIPAGSVVVAVDGSTHANRAVSWAALQASLEDRPLAVVHAADAAAVRAVPWVAVAGTRHDDTQDLHPAEQHLIEAAVELARQEHPRLRVDGHRVLGDPRRVVIDLSHRAHLVVLGSRGRGAFRSLALGSVSASVSRRAACPVVVCRPQQSGPLGQGVVVGADGTAESLPVIEFAFRFASLHDLPLTAMHCYWDVGEAVHAPGMRDPAPGLEELRLVLSESLAGLGEKFPDVRVDARLSHGLVDQVITDGERLWDLVVVGRHPRHTPARFLTSSMATAVLERAHTNVAVVPEAESPRT